MSQENVEVVRRGYEHYNRTGEPDYSLLDRDVVYDLSSRTFDPAVYHGHEGIRELGALIREQWATLRFEPQRFVDAGDDVVVSVRLVGVGKGSGAETTANAGADKKSSLWGSQSSLLQLRESERVLVRQLVGLARFVRRSERHIGPVSVRPATHGV